MPGIGTGICIPFRRGGFSYSSYWNTLISATVENAAPSHVVLTFPVAQTSLGASDFTIAGFTISSASWTGAVLTLLLDVGVTYYQGDFIITFVKTSETTTVTNNIADDGNTVGWYAVDDLSTITKDENDYVSKWANKMGDASTDLVGINNPIYSVTGMQFRGSQLLVVTKATVVPAVVYAIVKLNTWINEDIIYCGGPYKMEVSMTGSSPDIRMRGGGGATNGTIGPVEFPVGIWNIIKTKITATAGEDEILINNELPFVGDAGNINLTAISIGGRQDGVNCSDIDVIEFIIKKSEGDAEEAAIFNYIKNRLAFFLT